MKLRGILNSPVKFQPLEEELIPVLQYLKNCVLNAGCGERDISSFLLKHDADHVENCDISSSIPNAIVCDLTKIPRDENTYDSILCNAVLEHVQFPDLVIKELRRVLKPGGFLVLGVPFLQPYHPCPTDFQRYTKDGLLEIARLHDFEVVEILPVHSIAQTIGWILWEALLDNKKRVARLILWFPIYLWTRFSQKTDFSLINHANTYQIVLRKTQN